MRMQTTTRAPMAVPALTGVALGVVALVLGLIGFIVVS